MVSLLKIWLLMTIINGEVKSNYKVFAKKIGFRKIYLEKPKSHAGCKKRDTRVVVIKNIFKMIKKFIKRYFKGAFFLNVPLVINVIIGLSTLPIILRSLPIADYGKWQFVLALKAWILVFSAPYITSASKRGIARGLNGTFLYGFFARFKLLGPISILILLIAFYLKLTREGIFSILLAIMGFYLFFGYLFQVSFYEFLIAKKRFKEWCLWQVLVFFISMVGSTIIVYCTENLVYFALFKLGSISIISWIAFLLLFKREKIIESYKREEIDKECVNFGLKLIPVNLVSITADNISQFIIGSFLGFSNLAVFSIAVNLRSKFSAVNKSARTLVYADFAKAKRKELIKKVNHYLLKIGGLGILLTLGFIYSGRFYIKNFLPETFHQAIIYFTILALALPTGIIHGVLRAVLESHFRYKELTIVSITLSLLKVVLILIFGYFWKIIGICIALTICGWISFGFYYLLTVKKDLVVGNIKRFLLLKKLSNF